MSEFKTILDERFYGGEASVRIDGDQVSIYSNAGFQILEVSELPEDLVRKIKDVCDDMITNGEDPPQPLSTKSYSGRFIVRIPPAAHRKLTIEAAEEGISLNRLVSAKLSG